ncbi:FK506-binding protein 15-like [Dreissena polymorpha]|uniref:FK506-binding protein 15-like n=1 Tax=Dreissena polymorpha TaxID=45954 RepID=UPI00226486C9|nr:FK506-binding protein 15-like [Dreissena polymorpha]
MAERTVDLGSAYFEEMKTLQQNVQKQTPFPHQYPSAQPTQVQTRPISQSQPFPYQYLSVQPTGPYPQIQQPYPGQPLQFPPWQEGPPQNGSLYRWYPYPQWYPAQGQLQTFTNMEGHQGIRIQAGVTNHGFAPAGTDVQPAGSNVQTNVQPSGTSVQLNVLPAGTNVQPNVQPAIKGVIVPEREKNACRTHRHDERRQRLTQQPKTLVYSGKGSWKSFKSKFNRYVVVNDWSEREKKDYLCLCLTDTARDYHTLIIDKTPNITYNAIMEKLERRFGCQEIPETAEIKEGDLPLAESTPKTKAVPEDSNKFSSFYSSGYVTANQSLEVSPARVPVKQQIDIPVHSPNNQTRAGNVTSGASGSSTSSICSATNKGSFRTNMSFSHMQDILSSDLHSEMDEVEMDLNNVSKRDLIGVYKDVVQERDKLKSTMIQCQDRASRHISELKNQIAMEQQAKRDLVVKVNQEIEDKVGIIELLKESKEQQAAMLTDKARVDQELRELQAQFQKLQSSIESKLQQQVQQAREMIEQLKKDRQIAIAEMKQQVHEEIERKDGEILRSRSQAQSLGHENMQLKKCIERLEKASTNQLEKARVNQLATARAIFKRLKAEKSEAIAKRKSRLTENKMKVEKENLQKQGNEFQNGVRENNQLQTRLAQSEENFRKMNEQHNHTILERSELDMLVHQMQVEADRQKEEYGRPVSEAGHMSDASLAQLAAYHEKYEAEILIQHQTTSQKAEEHAADPQEVVSGYKAQIKAAREDQERFSESASQVTELQKAPEGGQAQLDKLNRSSEDQARFSVSVSHATELRKALEEGQVQVDKLIITLNTHRADLFLKEQELEQSSMEFRTKMVNHRAGAKNGNHDVLARKTIVGECNKYHLDLDLEDVDDVILLTKTWNKRHDKTREIWDPGIVNTKEVINKVGDPVNRLDTSH